MIITPFSFMATQAAAFTGLLDTYTGATVAYSLRKLSSSSTYAVEVRRSSDNATLDVGFSGEDLDTASLLSWAGTDTVYVTKWYDQSGNSNDAIQTTTTAQPIIAESSAMQTVNGKSAMNFDGTSDFFDLTSNYTTTSTFSTAWVFNRASAGIHSFSLGNSTAATPFLSYWFTDNNIYFRPGTAAGASIGGGTDTGQFLFVDTFASSTWELYRNGTSLGTRSYTAAASTINALGNRNGTTYNGKYQEYILWDLDQSSNVTGIESNINTYYSIYP